MSFSRIAIAVAAFVSASLYNTSAFSQGAGQNSTSSGALEEIVVTAEKRESNLQKVTESVEVLSPEQMADQGVRDFTNIDKVAPSLQVFQGAGDVVIAIRGLRSTSYDPTDESPNAVHIDGAYIARAAALNGLFYDIQRVEVLAGPQGTLYGRNSASGAINIITNKPTDQFSASGSVEAGTYELLRTEGALNIPVSDTLFMRLAASSYSHDGYARSGLDDAREQGARFEALWKPDDQQSLLFTADGEKNTPKGYSTTIVDVNPALQGANKFTVPSDPRDDTQIEGSQNLSYIDQQIAGVNAQYDYHFEPVTLTIQASHRTFSQDSRVITNFADTDAPAHSQASTVETRLTSNTTQPFQYVVGLFFFNEAANGHQLGYVSPTDHTEASLIDLEGQKTYSGAAFGQLTYTPAAIDALHLTVGGRYNYDRKSASSEELIIPIVNFTSPEQTKDWTKFTWKAGISYDLTPENMVYVNASTGYKSGGFTYGADPVTPPQTILAYEVGSKNRFLSDRLQINMDAYKYAYKNFESTFLDVRTFPFVLDVATAGSASIKGSDLDSLFAITRDDNFHASVAYLDTKYGAFNLEEITGIAGQPNLTGYPLPDTPRWSGLAGYTHAFRIADSSLEATLNFQYGGRRLVEEPAAGAPEPIMQGGYSIEDLSLKYIPSSSKWNATIYCNNFTNHSYIYTGIINTSGPISGTTTASISPPRTAGVIISASFK